jgi:hypothetical protein
MGESVSRVLSNDLPFGRSFLSAYDHSYALAAYPRRFNRDGPSLAAYLALLRSGFTLPQSLLIAR